MPIPAIILAAGASRRLGQPKQLAEFHGETLLNRTVRIAREAGADPVLVVLGAHFDQIRASLPPGDIVPVLNDRWQSGMASSIRAGLGALATCAPAADAALILACDQPRLSALHLRSLLALFAANESPIVASVYQHTRGTPAIFPRDLFLELSALQGDKGARSLLAEPPCALVEVDFPGGEVDIDIPADLERLS